MAARRLLAGLVVALIAGAAGVSTPASADITLPTITVDEVLSWGPGVLPSDGTTGMIVHADFNPDTPYETTVGSFTALTVDVAPSGGVMTLSAVPAGAADHATTNTEVDECTDPAFGTVGKRWSANDLPIEFSLNHKSVPKYMSPWLTTSSLREAHQVWGHTNTKCGDKDAIDFRFNYVGSTSKHIERDGTNNTDFGHISRRAVALTYLWYRGDKILEVDLRMSNFYIWTNRPGVDNRFNVKNVAVHEIGHTLGLDDLSQPHGSLTMFGVVGKGELRKTTLGKGDIRGAELLSP